MAEQAHIGSVAEQEVLGPMDLQAWELGAVTETEETKKKGLSQFYRFFFFLIELIHPLQ